MWSYEAPYPEVAFIRDYVAFYWNALDRWLEEDEAIRVHPRDPLTRIDVLDSRRRVRVVLGDAVLAESTRARFLFETGLPARYYLPREDVRTAALTPSETHTDCPYKGTASYWHVEVDGRRAADAVWSYPQPLPEAARIRDYLCFYPERVDRIEVEET